MSVVGPRNALEGEPQTGRSLAQTLVWPTALLTTGTTLAVYGQVITNAKATHPSSQIIAWSKYLVNLALSASVEVMGSSTTTAKAPGATHTPLMRRSQAPVPAAAELMCLLMGLLDVVAYSLNCLGFPLCGSALSMVIFAASGQIFTATVRVLLLGKRMSTQQKLAVAVVVVGLVVRGSPWTWLDPGHTATLSKAPSSNYTLGALYMVSSAACYSLLGVLYEKLFQNFSSQITHAQVNLRMSSLGLIALSLYQVFYTWPRRQRLVYDLMAAGGLEAWDVIVLHAGFGWLFTAHSYVQGQVLARSGAMSVGIINALRAATVTATSAWLFCSPNSPQQCLTVAAACSACIITCGVALWSTAHQPLQAPLQTVPSHDKDE